MKLFRALSIQSKLSLALLFSGTAIFSAIAVSLWAVGQYRLKERAEQVMLPYASFVSVGAEAAVNFQDPVRAREILGTLEKDSQIIGAEILLRDGHQLAAMGTLEHSSMGHIQSEWTKVWIEGAAAALSQNLHEGAQLHLLISLDKLQSEMRRSLLVFATATLCLITAVTLGVRSVLKRMIVGPIAVLAGKVEQVRTSSDYSQRVPLSGTDEIASLSRSFNALLGAIHQHESTLRSLNVLQRSILENAPYGIIAAGVDGQVLSFNRAAERLLGYTEAEVVGRLSVLSWHDPRELARYAESLSLLLGEPISASFEVFAANPRHGLPEEREWTFVRKDGSRVQASLSVTALRDQDGVITGYLGFTHDLTERRHTEQTLHQLSAAVEQSPVSVIITDIQGRIEYANARSCELSGYSRAELIGKNPRLFKSGVTKPEEYARMWRVISSGGEWRGELCNKKKSGELLWEIVVISPLRDNAGNISHYIGIKEDVTARKQARERIRQQAALLDQTQDAVFVLGFDHRPIFCNRSALRACSMTMEQMQEADVATLLFPERPGRFKEVIGITRERGLWTGELRSGNGTGAPRSILSRWTLIVDDEGRSSSILIVNTDTTELKRMEEQLLRSQRMESIGALAGGIAHDLNNILTPILLSASMLRMDVSDATDLESVDVIEQSALRGKAIINQLLTYGRGIEGKRMAIQLLTVLKEMGNVVRETFPRNIVLNLQIPPSLWQVQGNPTQLHQVLLNLCVNSRDAMPAGGTLTIAAENVMLEEDFVRAYPDAHPGAHIRLHVADTGTGIAPEIMSKIFDPFFTTKSYGKGTGLGLSTVMSIVRGHGGFLQVSSQLGVGTHFSVFLPAEPKDAGSETVHPFDVLPQGNGELILVVDDEECIRSTTYKILKAHGYEVVLVKDGAEALQLVSAAKEPVSVVITDMQMPGVDGAALIRALRASQPGLGIIAVSGMLDQESVAVQMGLPEGCFLIKPYSAFQLLTLLSRVLARRTASDPKPGS